MPNNLQQHQQQQQNKYTFVGAYEHKSILNTFLEP